MQTHTRRILPISFAVVAALATTPIHGATITWDADTDADFNTATNWVGDALPAAYVPTNTTSGDIAAFDDTQSPLGNQTPTLSADYTLRGVTFGGSGWTLDTDASTLNISYRGNLVANNTSGTNTINGRLRFGGFNSNQHADINVAAGGTLRINANIGIFADSNSGGSIGNTSAPGIEKRGAGTLELNTTGSWGSSGLRIFEGTVRLFSETAGGVTGNGNGGLGTGNNRDLILNGGLLDLNGATALLRPRTLQVAAGAEMTNSDASFVTVRNKAGGGQTIAGEISGNINMQYVSNASATTTISSNLSYVGSTQVGRSSGSSGTNTVVVKTDALVNQDGALGNSDTAVLLGGLGNNGGNARLLTDATVEIGRDITLINDSANSDKILGARNSQVGTSVYSGTVTVGNGENADLQVTAGATGQADFTGSIVESAGAGTGSVEKIGVGVVRFAGANTYAGGTTITEGTLLVDNTTGSGTGTGAVNVDAGVLGGGGTISGAVTVGDGSGVDDATLAAGNSIGGLTVGGLTFDSDGLFDVEVDSDSILADEVVANGDVALGAGIAELVVTDLGGSALSAGTLFTIIDNVSGTTSGFFNGLTDGSQLTVGLNTFVINYDGGVGGNDVTLTIIPEPGVLALLAVGGLLMAQRGRRRGAARP